ncbi:MAG TPA: phasin family protein [Ramlibacter sp.]|uniref:phasin family protein n=1 Tax=Ramlibacter sp. TaxID=1917967 RepID=UPI002ED16328
MAVRNIRSAPSAQQPAASAPSANDWATDFTRQQMLVASESACALFRGFQAIRGIQEQAAQHAAERHAEGIERLRRAGNALDLMSVQGELMRSDLESATQYWQQLAGAALEMNTELVGCTAHLVGTEDLFGATRFLRRA